ncbi:hypothetical protein HPP92_019699 [Vanilla planifolia]|uniref:Uncharacterized protein n=1 Tax=Vanilla planifolia TaxID=51239 RepID=A0A835ULZ8_VANPL|nr:hypothetical protein HPP92_019699 [Vanilla planifolia]
MAFRIGGQVGSGSEGQTMCEHRRHRGGRGGRGKEVRYRLLFLLFFPDAPAIVMSATSSA